MAYYLLTQIPIRQLDNNGDPQPGAKLYTYASGTTTPKAAYTDSTGATPLTNPVVADANGFWPQVWVDATTYRLEARKNDGVTTLWGPVDGIRAPEALSTESVSTLRSDLASSIDPAKGTALVGHGNSLVYPAGTTGARLNEEVSATGFITLQLAVNTAATAGKVLKIYGAWSVSATVTLANNANILLMPGAVVTCTNPAVSVFKAVGASNITIRGSDRQGAIKYSTTSGASYIAGVEFTSCNKVTVKEVNFDSMAFAGILMTGCHFYEISKNLFDNPLGTQQNTCDINLIHDCEDGKIFGNDGFGANGVGLLIISPVGNGVRTAKRNLAQLNRFRNKNEYGVVLYTNPQACVATGSVSGSVLTLTAITSGTMAVGTAVYSGVSGAFLGNVISFGSGAGGTGTYNLANAVTAASGLLSIEDITPTWNHFDNNDVRDIKGDPASNASSGAGYYFVGSGISGTIFSNNTAHNCCTMTTTLGLAPGGVGVSNTCPGMVPMLLIGTTVTGMTQGSGIYLVNLLGGVVLSGSNVVMPASNNGTGPGGAALGLSGIDVKNSNDVTVDGSDVTHNGSGNALLAFASNLDCNNLTVTGGTYTAGTAAGVLITGAGGNMVRTLQLSSPRIKTTGNSFPALQIGSLVGGTFGEVVASSGTQPAVSVSGSTGARFSAGSYTSTGAVNVYTTGTCTGGFMDRSVNWGTNPAAMSNNGTGFNVEWRNNAMPTAGIWQQGDLVPQSVFAVGQPTGWARITSSANNVLGTDWKALPNL